MLRVVAIVYCSHVHHVRYKIIRTFQSCIVDCTHVERVREKTKILEILKDDFHVCFFTQSLYYSSEIFKARFVFSWS